MPKLSRIILALSLVLAFPALAFAQEAVAAASSFDLGSMLSGMHEVAPWVTLLGSVAAFLVACSKFLPGWATKLNAAAGFVTGIAAALGALGPKATIIGMVLAFVGVVLGYNRSNDRAAGA
jgi:hypothetical protein